MATNMKSDQDERKRDQEYRDLYRFALPQGLRRVLCQQAKNSTKKITKISSIQYNFHCSLQVRAKLCSTQATTPHNSYKQCRTVLHNPNYKPYAIWVRNVQLKITNPM